jgi:alpha-1,6-mannosyltransferase
MSQIVQVANFYGPESGGLKTAVEAVGRGYRTAGHHVTLVVPGPRDAVEDTPAGRRITLQSPSLPGGPYRVLVNWPRLVAVLSRLRPDRLEVSDKLTLALLGRWAAARGIPSVLWSHERIDAILAARTPSWVPLARAADVANQRLARWFDTIVCSSSFAAAEFERIGATPRQVPLGVDLEVFRPNGRPPLDNRSVELIYVGRLSMEKRADLAVTALRRLTRSGLAAHLTVVGSGPERSALEAAGRGLPLTFTGQVSDRAEVARLLASADVALAPCPAETFGLSVLEALACGTPVVTTNRGAAHEVLAPGCGLAVQRSGEALAAGVRKILASSRPARSRAARRRAEQYPWSATVAGLLAAHQLTPTELASRRSWAS